MSDEPAGRSSTQKVVNKPKKRPNKHQKLVKRPPVKEEEGEHIIYVNSKSSIKALVAKCSNLVHQETPEIIIYCMGAAISGGILLALEVSEKHKSYQISANTFTTELTDDLEPTTDEADYEIQHRLNSAMKITLIKT